MGRPQLVLDAHLATRLHEEQRWSIREIARYLQCSRWTVRRTLEAAGVTIRQDIEAAALRRFLEPEPESHCLSPGCAQPARGYCTDHQGIVDLAIRFGGCAHPRCIQTPPKGKAWCYGHEKAVTPAHLGRSR